MVNGFDTRPVGEVNTVQQRKQQLPAAASIFGCTTCFGTIEVKQLSVSEQRVPLCRRKCLALNLKVARV